MHDIVSLWDGMLACECKNGRPQSELFKNNKHKEDVKPEFPLTLFLAFIMKDRVVQTCAHKSQLQMKSPFIDLLMHAKHKKTISIIQQSNY